MQEVKREHQNLLVFALVADELTAPTVQDEGAGAISGLYYEFAPHDSVARLGPSTDIWLWHYAWVPSNLGEAVLLVVAFDEQGNAGMEVLVLEVHD